MADEGNTNAGTAKAILTGLPPYVGSVTNEFTIAKRPVTLTSATKIDFIYNGQSHQLPVLIKSGNWFVEGEGITTSNWAKVTAVGAGFAVGYAVGESGGAGVPALVWFCEDGTVEAANLHDPKIEAQIANQKAGAYQHEGAAFRIDSAAVVALTGIVLGGKGYGTAALKGQGSVPVTIE